MKTLKKFFSHPEHALLRRIAPPLAFIFALCLLVVFCYGSGYSSLPPTEKRYMTAKASVANLKKNEKKNKQREPWQNLAAEFKSIYDADPAWPNRAAALYRAAESLEELARRSCAKADARQAINCYETLALRHASSRLADDALFRAASMRAAWLRDENGALSLLERLKKQYPNGDMLQEALALEKVLKASARGKIAPEELKKVVSASKDILDEQTSVQTPKTKFSGDLPLRYKAAKSRLTSLRSDKLRSCWRSPWEDLQNEFMTIYKAGKNRLGPAALYNAAVCQQAIAECSHLSSDRKKAQDLFISVHRQYPKHSLADDALLNIARLSLPRDTIAAKANLEKIIREYPRGDMLQEARRLLSQLNSNPKTVVATKGRQKEIKQQPELQVLSWDSVSRNSVEIVLEFSAPAKFATKLIEANKNQPARLILDLENAAIVNDVRKGVTVQGSLLKAVRVKDRKGGGYSLQFDFRDVKRYDARAESDPCRIILSVAAGKASLPRKNQAVLSASNTKKATPAARQISNMASQLGLTVHRIFIDAGHGGKDPGTSHNKVLERAITLDVALALGRLLQTNGLEVIYSRTKDKSVPLSDRTKMANAAKADLFVSIHVNANDNPAINGLESYYLSLASNSQAARVAALENATSDRHLGDMQSVLADVMLNARADESKRLATDIQRLAIFRAKKRSYIVRNNGVKSAPFHVLLGAQMPAVLVEIGYCSNAAEAQNLANPKYRHALAEGLAEGILAYRDRLRKNHTAENILTDSNAGAM